MTANGPESSGQDMEDRRTFLKSLLIISRSYTRLIPPPVSTFFFVLRFYKYGEIAKSPKIKLWIFKKTYQGDSRKSSELAD